MFACPRSSWTRRRSAPPAGRWVAKLWRGVCGLPLELRPAPRPAFLVSIVTISRRSLGRPPLAYPPGAEGARHVRATQMSDVIGQLTHLGLKIILQAATRRPVREALQVTTISLHRVRGKIALRPEIIVKGHNISHQLRTHNAETLAP